MTLKKLSQEPRPKQHRSTGVNPLRADVFPPIAARNDPSQHLRSAPEPEVFRCNTQGFPIDLHQRRVEEQSYHQIRISKRRRVIDATKAGVSMT
jgi:hypothetical protein